MRIWAESIGPLAVPFTVNDHHFLKNPPKYVRNKTILRYHHKAIKARDVQNIKLQDQGVLIEFSLLIRFSAINI